MIYKSEQAVSVLPFECTLIFYSDSDDISLYNAGSFDIMDRGTQKLNETTLDTFADGTPTDLVNPYLIFTLPNLKNSAWFVGNMRMIDDPSYYNQSPNITSSMAGAMVEQTFYGELNEQFISVLCDSAPSEYVAGDFQPVNLECGCTGFAFGGMPEIYMDMSQDDSKVFVPGRIYSYALLPQDYLFYPKVSATERTTSCALGLWNIGDVDSNYDSTEISYSSIYLGKFFIRKFKMALSWTYSTGSDAGQITIYVTEPSDNSDFALDLTLLSLMMFGLLLFVVLMTRLRKARYNQEKDNFKKLKLLQEEDPSLTLEMLRIQNQRNQVIEAVQSGEADVKKQA